MWELNHYKIDELLRIQDAVKTLESYGIEQDEELCFELNREIMKKQFAVVKA